MDFMTLHRTTLNHATVHWMTVHCGNS